MVSVRHSLLSLFGFTTGKELLVISTDKALDELPWHCSNLSRDWALYKNTRRNQPIYAKLLYLNISIYLHTHIYI